MAQNIGTLITAAIRPNDSSDLIASAFANEIKGGFHSVTASSDRNNIIDARREWGMLVNVLNDSKTYELKFNHVDTNISNNSNWIEYSPGGLDTSEWLDSVQEVSTFPSIFTDGYRYLVDDSGTGLFNGQDGKIAVYNLPATSFVFSIPTNGQTLRVDNIKNVIYKFQGIYGSGGKWVKEFVNQVRYLNLIGDGMFFGASSSLQNSIDSYSQSVFYCNFNTTSTGTVSVSIDNLSYIEVKKLQNNVFSSIVAGEIVPNINYQLIVNDGGFFQTVLPSSTTTTIGSAEDGNYTDGLFTDFTTSTPIGTAVDRFNEILKALMPASAPNLNSWSATASPNFSGQSILGFVDGGISFDNTTGGGFVSATSSPYGGVNKGGTFSLVNSDYRLGIYSGATQTLTGGQYYFDITGTFNSGVLQSTQTPYPAYTTNSFGNGNTGSIFLVLNGVTISSVGLTGASVDTTNSGATSGVTITSATSSLFSSGVQFDTFQNRTGTYRIKRDNSNLVEGYNYVVVKHIFSNTTLELNRYEWIKDSNTNLTSVSNPQITSRNTPNTKLLSGIKYYNAPCVFRYDVTINNLFSNTFNMGTDTIEYRDVSISNSSITNTVTNTVTNNGGSSIFNPNNQYSLAIPNGSITPTSTMLASMTFSVLPNRRRINDSIAFAITAKRTVQGTFIGGTSSNIGPVTTLNWYVDTFTTQSTTFSESFADEKYRLNNGTSKYNSYHLISDITSGTNDWLTNQSLYSGSPGHNNGLQVINGMLIYPNYNFDNDGSSISNPNFGLGSSVNYTNCSAISLGFGTSSSLTSNRSYTRWFYFGGIPGVGTPFNFSKATLRLNYTGTNFVKSTQNISNASDAWLEIKLPYGSSGVPGGTQSSGSITGWLDATHPFQTGQYGDSSGCLEGNLPMSGQDWLINFGIKGTQYSNGYVLLRITTSPSYTGNISSIELVGRL